MRELGRLRSNMFSGVELPSGFLLTTVEQAAALEDHAIDLDTQLVAELEPFDGVGLDLRAGYANSRREAPYELSFEYVRTNAEADPYGAHFVNRLNRNNGSGDIWSTTAFSSEPYVSSSSLKFANCCRRTTSRATIFRSSRVRLWPRSRVVTTTSARRRSLS